MYICCMYQIRKDEIERSQKHEWGFLPLSQVKASMLQLY